MTRMRRLHTRYGAAIEEAIVKAKASRGIETVTAFERRYRVGRERA